MKMKNGLKTTLAIGLVAATSTVFVACGGTAKGDPMNFADGAAAYGKVTEYTNASIQESDKDTGYTMDFNAYIKDFGANIDASINNQYIGSGKKAERVYQYTSDMSLAIGAVSKVDTSSDYSIAKYGENYIMYNEKSKEKVDLLNLTNLVETIINPSSTQEQGNIQLTNNNTDMDTMFSSIIGLLATSGADFDYTEEQFKAQNETNAAIEAAAGAKKTIMGAEFLTLGENSYIFKINTETTSWAQKAGTTAATDLDTTVSTNVVEYEITDGKITKLSNSSLIKENGEDKIKYGYSVGIKYEAKKLTAVSVDTLNTYKDIVADSSIMKVFDDVISGIIGNVPSDGNSTDSTTQNNDNQQGGGE